jgi:hypothetical protein
MVTRRAMMRVKMTIRIVKVGMGSRNGWKVVMRKED